MQLLGTGYELQQTNNSSIVRDDAMRMNLRANLMTFTVEKQELSTLPHPGVVDMACFLSSGGKSDSWKYHYSPKDVVRVKVSALNTTKCISKK